MNRVSIPGAKFDLTYTNLPEALYSHESPWRAEAPRILLLNAALFKELGLKFNQIATDDILSLFSGHGLTEGMTPIAQAYAGHQFGNFTILGDGRAILLTEHTTPNNGIVDIQLKGSGRTRYSRAGDGLAALGPMIREYVISEAMQALNIPTTRSLAVIETGTPVYRNREEKGAILARIASSHLRVGTFQFAATQQDTSLLNALVSYAIQRHRIPETSDTEAASLLNHVVTQQAQLICHWMRVGFVHGVMNTDNMTISGETIDYGPCAFMDQTDMATVFSSIDHWSRYAFGSQPNAAQWNIARFAEALLPVLHPDQDEALKIAQHSIDDFSEQYNMAWLNMMRQKLGLSGEDSNDRKLVTDLLDIMQNTKADYTHTFRTLSRLSNPSVMPDTPFFQSGIFKTWQQHWWQRRLAFEQTMDQSEQIMRQTNPARIPRNHMVEDALQQACIEQKDALNFLLDAIKEPYVDKDDFEDYSDPPPDSLPSYKTFCGT